MSAARECSRSRSGAERRSVATPSSAPVGRPVPTPSLGHPGRRPTASTRCARRDRRPATSRRHAPSRACSSTTPPRRRPATPTGLTPVSAAPTITFIRDRSDSAACLRRRSLRRLPQRRSRRSTRPVAVPYRGGRAAAVDTRRDRPCPYTYTVEAVDVAATCSSPSRPRDDLPRSGGGLAPTVGHRPRDADQPAPAGLLGRAASPFVLDHYKVYRGGAFVLGNVAAAPRPSPTTRLPDGAYTYQVVAENSATSLGIASAPVTVTYDAGARSAGRRSAAARRSTAPSRIGWAAASDGAGSGIARYVVRRSLSSSPPVVGRRRRRHLPGHCSPRAWTRRRSTASSTATRCSRSTRVGNTSPAGGSAARDGARPARARRRPKGSRRRRATPASTCAGGRGRGRRRGRLRARRQAGHGGAGERRRRHARLHRDRGGVDDMHGDRSDERRDVHVRPLRAGRGAQPLAGRRRERGAERAR